MGSGLNLIPAGLLARRRARRGVRRSLRVTAAYLSLLLIGTLAYLTAHAPRSADAASQLAVGRERLALLQHQVAEHAQQIADLDRRINGARVLSERPDWSALLRLVAQAAGDQVVLTQFRITTTGQGPAAGAEVRVGGIAADPWTVSGFALRLEEHAFFDRVQIESSRREPFRDRVATGFMLRCTLAPPQAGVGAGAGSGAPPPSQ